MKARRAIGPLVVPHLGPLDVPRIGPLDVPLAALAVLFSLTLVAGGSVADPIEPPLEADPGADYVAEPSDSLEAGSAMYGYGIGGRSGSGVATRRSFAFEGDSLDVALRDGDDDPYRGGDVGAKARSGEFRAGRVAPRWGLGLVMGTPREPWSAFDDAALEPWAPRARSGDGALWRAPAGAVEMLCARFAKRTVTGVALRRGALGVGIAGRDAAPPQASLGLGGEDASIEGALDRAGRWRGEAALRRGDGGGAWLLRLRAGHTGWRSLTDPRRFDPPALASASRTLVAGALTARITLATWRYAADTVGSRAAVEAAWPAGGGRLRLGVEEQHGAWRPHAVTHGPPRGMRQGTWIEWRGGSPALGLVARHESWGRRPFARAVVRGATGAGIEARLPLGVLLAVSHTVYRVTSGETLYLPERDADRWVLRALSGAGQRSRIAVRCPFSGGQADGELALQPVRGVVTPRWDLRWSRRVRVRGG